MIRVETQRLVLTAADMQSRIGKLSEALEGMQSVMDKTGNLWLGEAADAHRRAFDAFRSEREEAVARFKEQAKELFEMAGVYEKAERDAVEEAEKLPDDVII